jgi:hypothetical protein
MLRRLLTSSLKHGQKVPTMGMAPQAYLRFLGRVTWETVGYARYSRLHLQYGV